MLFEGKLEVLPVVLVVDGLDIHVLVDLDQVPPGVDVGAAKDEAEKLREGGMESSNIADISM